MNDDYDFYFGRLSEVGVRDLAFALGATDGLGTTGQANEDRARRMFARIHELKRPDRPRTPREDLATLRLAEAAAEYNPAFTFTAAELDSSLQRTGFIPWPGLPAVLKDIKDHREPEWVVGDVVRDVRDVLYRFNQNGRWNRFGSTSSVHHDEPKRPLTRLGKGNL
jgi:hypothetical protein